ncbi:hypothetical protein PIB30_031010 [Stylosanthes scabra]|uniref:Uncharacterized protein n=1 Tax=Stylosanthes scabra TaxID=79078 RepID=A0ABU6WF89_9FABA|nr:hypothetical protein [Stylosanthes scabra]
MANELIRSVIRPTRPGLVANQWTVSLIIPRRKTGRRSKPSTFLKNLDITTAEPTSFHHHSSHLKLLVIFSSSSTSSSSSSSR